SPCGLRVVARPPRERPQVLWGHFAPSQSEKWRRGAQKPATTMFVQSDCGSLEKPSIHSTAVVGGAEAPTGNAARHHLFRIIRLIAASAAPTIQWLFGMPL